MLRITGPRIIPSTKAAIILIQYVTIITVMPPYLWKPSKLGNITSGRKIIQKCGPQCTLEKHLKKNSQSERRFLMNCHVECRALHLICAGLFSRTAGSEKQLAMLLILSGATKTFFMDNIDVLTVFSKILSSHQVAYRLLKNSRFWNHSVKIYRGKFLAKNFALH